MRSGVAPASGGRGSSRVGGRRGEEAGEVKGVVSLMPRDLHLLAAVGTARYLSTEQVADLFFEGRTYKHALRRLRHLERGTSRAGDAGGEGVTRRAGYLRRVEAVSFAGDRVEAWTLSQRGAVAVASGLGLAVAPVERVLSAQFVSHQVRLSDVFVGMLKRCAPMGGALPVATPRKGGRVARFPRMKVGFRWLVAEAARLPWREFDVKGGAARDRYIAPDATLEVGGRRIFLEMETGSHPISSGNPSRRGATSQKLAAYDAFVGGYEGIDRRRTFYEARFGDSLPAEVIFIVESEARAANVSSMISEHREGSSRGASARALVVDDAVAYLSEAAGAAHGRSAPPVAADGKTSSESVARGAGTLSASEVVALHNLYVAYNGWRRKEKAAGRAVPPKPDDLAVAYNALKRLLRE